MSGSDRPRTWVRSPANACWLFIKWLRFHADQETIDAWIAERLGTKSFREMLIPRGDDSMGLDWFDPHNIKTGKAFVEDAAAGGEQIFVDDERTLVIFHN
ncbi:MAG: hypothetical protein WDZ48_06665 [Pirellulales bacterium]